MASYNVALSKHATLVGGTVDTVTLTGGLKQGEQVEVINRGSVDLYFRIDSVDPVVGADNTIILRPGTSVVLNSSREIRLISTGTPDYSVQLVN